MAYRIVSLTVKILQFCCSFVVLLCAETPRAIILSNVMKCILERATQQFDKNLAEGMIVDLGPYTLTHHGSFFGDMVKDAADSYITYPYISWDPITQFQSIVKQNLLDCPLCLDDGFMSNPLFRSGEWFNGRLNRLNPRVVYDTHTCTLLVSCVYKCTHGHKVSACHAGILETLTDKANAGDYVPFLLTHKNGFTVDLAVLVENLIDSGLSFEQVEMLIKMQYKQTYDKLAKNFWMFLEQSKKNGFMYEEDKVAFPEFSVGNFPCPANDILMDIFLKRFFQNEQIYVNAMNKLNADMISCDHTFKSACNIGYKRAQDGAWINQYNSIFCILNEQGEIINWQFTKSEGFDEVRNMFMNIKQRSKDNGLKLICIDNCCKWSSLLADIFPGVSIKQDLFHAVQRFVKTLKKRDPVQRDVASDFGKIFRCPQDLGDTRKMPTPSKDVLISNLQNFLKKWENRESNGVKRLTPDRISVISNIRGHILKGCLSGIPARFSTSVNERLHKEMKKLLAKNRMGTQLAYAKFTRFFFKHNQKRGNCDSICSLAAKRHQNSFKGADSNVPISLPSKKVFFGIRPKERDSVAFPVNFDQKIKEQETCPQYTLEMLTPAVLDAMSEKIDTAWNKGAPERRRLQPDHTYSFDEATANNRYFSIMLYSLSIFKVILLMKKLWSSKAGMLMKIPFLFDGYKTYFSHNPTDNYGKFTATTAMDTETSVRSDKERLANIASSFGFSILPVTGDGNCFFRAVAFQLLQILTSKSCPQNISENLQAYGINDQTNADELSKYLRQLTVDEFQKNPQHYSSFFEGIDIYTESEKFRRNGEFSGRLGDALPLAMTNVLNIPIIILTTVHNMPFLSLAPRTNFSHDVVIYLSYIQDGPGHYDAVVVSEQVSETAQAMSKTNDLQPIDYQFMFR